MDAADLAGEVGVEVADKTSQLGGIGGGDQEVVVVGEEDEGVDGDSRRALGSAEDAEKYVTRLLDECAVDGGFMLMSGAVVDDAKPETLQAMIETGRAWKG